MASLAERYQVDSPVIPGISVYMMNSQNDIAAGYDLGPILGAFAELAFPARSLSR
jgi:hypothetical protein